MKKALIAIFIIFISVFHCSDLKAQGCFDPANPECGYGNPDDQAPLDGGSLFLAAAATWYAIKKLKGKKSEDDPTFPGYE